MEELVLRLLNTTNGSDIGTEVWNGTTNDIDKRTEFSNGDLLMIGLLSIVIILLIFGNTILCMNHLNGKKMVETVT